MERSDVIEVIRETFQQELTPMFERMFEFLSSAMDKSISQSERQFEAYQDMEQELRKLIESNASATHTVEGIRSDYSRRVNRTEAQNERYAAELQSAKAQIIDLKEQLAKTTEAYVRLADQMSRRAEGGSTVNIKSSNL